MRVLMTTDTVGGVWTYALELADALAAHDTEVVLATIGPPPSPGQRAELARSAVVDVRSLDGLLEWMDDPWADLERSGEWLLELADEVRPDLVHLNAYAHGTLPWGVPVVVVGHSCVLSWWRAVRRENAPAEWDAYREAVTAGLALADLVVAPTRTMLDELERLYAPPGLTAAIPNGRRPPAVRGRKEPLVLAAGRLWDEAKNVAALDRVAPRLRWPVVVAGEGPAPVNAHGLGHLRRDELDSWLSRASIFALPARYEPFGLAALEAAGAGAALVLGDIPSLREVWGDAALYVDPDDDDELAAALTRLAAEPELRTGMAERAVARAGAYTPARMGAAYAAAYAALVPTEAAA